MMARLRHFRAAGPGPGLRSCSPSSTWSTPGDRRAGTYSGGMKRRLDLAISMIERPRLLFLDEPTTGLDPRSREQLWATVRGLVDDGVTILLTTQYLEEADQLADMIAMLDPGRVVAQGTRRRAQGEPRRPRSCGCSSPMRRLLRTRRSAASIAVARRRPPAGHRRRDRRIGGRRPRHARPARAAGAPAPKVSMHRPSLDDVFLSLTGSEPAPTPHRRRWPDEHRVHRLGLPGDGRRAASDGRCATPKRSSPR